MTSMRITDHPGPTRLTQASFRQLFTSPAVWIPGLAGVVAIGAAVVTGGAAIGWVGLGLAITAAGVSAYQWMVGRERLERRAMAAILREAEREELQRLKVLRQDLRQDRDPHSTQLVRQLRDTFERIVGIVMQQTASPQRRTPLRDNLDTSTALYESCQRLLRRSVQLWRAARNAATEAIQEDLQGQRESLLRQVEASIEQLNASLDEMHADSLRDDGSVEANQRLQQELQMGLETAKRVEERIDELEREIGYRERI